MKYHAVIGLILSYIAGLMTSSIWYGIVMNSSTTTSQQQKTSLSTIPHDCSPCTTIMTQSQQEQEPITTTTTTTTTTNTTTTSSIQSFTELVKSSGSDKYSLHHYENYYERWLRPYRDQINITFLEIGAREGKSLKLWEQYFLYPKIILGVAYGVGTYHLNETFVNSSIIQIYYGDQSKKSTMDDLIKRGPYDIIMDDGSHVPTHVLFSLFSLWNSIKPGGIYIIEDIETNYWPDGTKQYGYRLEQTGIDATPQYSVIAKLQQFIHVLIRYQIGATDILSIMPGDENICSIEWGMNVIAITKCPTNITKPITIRPFYDKDRMTKWIQEAKRTNPIIV